jgi:hypothetical protein
MYVLGHFIRMSEDRLRVWDDWQANKSGFLGTSQRDTLKQMRQRMIFAYIWFIVWVPVAPLILEWKYPLMKYLYPYMYIALILLWMTFIIAATAWVVRRMWRLRLEIEDPNIQQVEGIPQLKVVGEGSNQILEIILGGKKFRLSHIYEIWFHPEKRYRLYYLPRTMTVLSMEALDPFDDPNVDTVLSLYVPPIQLPLIRRGQTERI